MVNVNTPQIDGGQQHTPVESQLTVDPGQIQQFASFLAEMAEAVSSMHQKLDGLGVKPDDFGVHAGSQKAGSQHDSVLTTSITNLGKMRTRIEELADGSNELARLYTDTEELNRANAAQITDALNREDR